MITLTQIIQEIHKWERFSTVPDKEKFPHYSSDYVFDIDKSVRWNQIQIELANEARNKELARLKDERCKMYDHLVDLIKAYIMQETNCTQAELNVIYNYVHDKYTDDIVDTLEETIDFCNDLRKARRLKLKETLSTNTEEVKILDVNSNNIHQCNVTYETCGYRREGYISGACLTCCKYHNFRLNWKPKKEREV